MEEEEEVDMVGDYRLILSQIKKQSKESRIKRRWLMNMKLTKHETAKIKKLLPPKDHFLPDSFLRQDDIYYEFLKNHISTSSSEIKNSENSKELEKKDDEDERYAMLFNSQGGLREIFDMLDCMKIQAVCCFAQILTGGSDNFMKTKFQIRRFIKKCLQGGINDKSSSHKQKIVHMSKILRDPRNYHGKHIPHLSPSNHYRAAAVKILNDIDNFPTQALACMYRKLNSKTVHTPKIENLGCVWSHRSLVEKVRKKCMKFLSELGEEGSLQLPLAHALAVASLTVTLKFGSASLTEFRKFSPEIVALQKDIMKAIWLLEELSFAEVNHLLLLLDPNAQTNKNIRISVRNLMTVYLFECADMDNIPGRLTEALSFFEKRALKVSCHSFSKEDLGTEVEGVLAVSSQAKQIIWDFLPECENDIDIEFANAYQDDMLDSDDDLKGVTSPCSDDLYNQIEGCGETLPSCLTSPFNEESKEDNTVSGIKNMDKLEFGNSGSPLLLPCFEQEENDHIIAENKYLAIQKACDSSSTVAYDLIGGLLTKFAEVEGIDLNQDDLSYLQSKGTESSESEVLSWKNVDNYGSIVHILQEQIQSKRMSPLSSSSMEKLKKMMM